MSDPRTRPAGSIAGLDITVPDADGLRDFYASVVGWQPSPLDMGGYADYMMMNPDGSPGAGICHARGVNADLPPQWLVYVLVDDIQESRRRCTELGGTLLTPVKGAGGGSGGYCVIRDPAGAVMALMERVR